MKPLAERLAAHCLALGDDALVYSQVVLSLALIAGAAFGLMPARRAAALQPTEALRGKR